MVHERKVGTEPAPLSPPVLYILLAVADRELHGYGIMQEVDRQTGGRLRLLPGSLYSTIKRIQGEGLIAECKWPAGAESEGPRRRYYRITAAGRQAAARELERMSVLMEFARGKKLLPRHAGTAARSR